MENDNEKFKNKVAIIISPNWRDYAVKYLSDCVASIKKQDYAGELKIFITDNESTEESYRYLRNVFESKIPPTPFDKGGEIQPSSPSFAKGGKYEIIRNKNNDGFAKGNNDAIKKALKQGFPYIILFNMDTVLRSDCVTQMIKAMGDKKLFLDSRRSLPSTPIGGGNDKKDMDTVLEKDCVEKMVEAVEDKIPLAPFDKGGKKEIGAMQARLMLYKDNLTPASPSKGEGLINSLGNVTHFLGFGYSRGYGEEYKSPLPLLLKGGEICYPSGAAVLYKSEVLKKIGLFDEQFWLYNEDQDLGWRIWLAGFSCILASRAVVYHKYQFSRSIKKYYFMDRNRIIAMLKNYHWTTLLLIAPAFLIMEVGLIFFAFKGGWLKEKIKVYKYFLSLKNWRYLGQARRQAQSLRQVKDKDIIKLFSGRIWYQEIGEWKLKIANAIFDSYWRAVKILIRW